jgi:HlyD family secretion protein
MINPNRNAWLAFPFLLLLALLIVSCSKHEAAERPRDRPAPSAVTALGRVTPGRAVISIAAEPGSRILSLDVGDGQKVKAGDVLAKLESYTLRTAERDAAKVALAEARERLETETAYGQTLIEQNRRAVRVLEIAVEHERKQLKRFETLRLVKVVEEQRIDDQKFLVDTRESELAKAQAELAAAEAALARTRSTIAVRSAEAQLVAAEAQLELTIIRAPIDGEILKILTYPGERIGNDPILKMGNTADMHVIAEVHETDVGFVRVGQRVTVVSEALNQPVQGTVEEIGALIYKNDVLNLDPRADKDTRIVEVRVKLDNSEPVSRLAQLEVSVRIVIDTPTAAVKSAAR